MENENKIIGEACGFGTITAGKDENTLPSFTMEAYNGGVIGQYFGNTIVDLSGVEFAKTVAILWHHDTEQPIGHSTIAKVEDGKIKVEGVLSGDKDDPVLKKVIAMAKNGFPWQVSIGADILKREFIEAGQKEKINGIEVEGPIVVARKSLVYETSFLPLGADSSTSATVAAKKGLVNGAEHSQGSITKGDNMEFKKWLQAKGFGDVKDLSAEITASLQKMYEAEKDNSLTASRTEESEKEILKLQAEVSEMKRIEAIKDLTVGHIELQKTAIEKGMSVDAVEASVKEIEKVRAERSAPAVHFKQTGSQEGSIEAAFQMGMGIKAESLKADFSEDAIDEATSIKADSFSQLARLLLIREGKYNPAQSKEEMLRAGFSTTGLSNILSNTGNKILLAAKMAYPSTFGMVSDSLLVSDFKAISLNDLTMDLTLTKLGNNGEIKHGTMGDSVQTANIDMYARQLKIGRKELINDDLGAFERMFAGFGKGAVVAEERNGWQTYVTATSMFSSSNAVTGATSALGIEGLELAWAKLAGQVDENGDPIDTTGTKLVVPHNLAVTAKQLMSSTMLNETTTANKAKGVNNPFAGMFEIVVSPYLNNANVSGGSATTWYLQADPSVVPAYVNMHLQSAPQPVVRRGEVGIGDGFGIVSDAVYDFGAEGVIAKKYGIIKMALA